MSTERSGSPASINTLQIALVSLKDRCQKQQKRIDELERENHVLSMGHPEVVTEMNKLREANTKLREKNLQLNHDLHKNNREYSEMKDELEAVRVTQLRNARNAWTSNQEAETAPSTLMSANTDTAPNTLMSVSEELDPASDVMTNIEDDQTSRILHKAEVKMKTIRETVLQERNSILHAIQTLKQRQAVSALNAEGLISASLATAHKLSTAQSGTKTEEEERRCPMCEASFPISVSHEEFESHVVEHFSYEESETLKNFDVVPDAWDGMHGMHGVLHDDQLY